MIMKKIFTKTIGFFVLLGLFVSIAPAAHAQYVKDQLEGGTNEYIAMAKDKNNNVYVIESASSNTAQIVKYVHGHTTGTNILPATSTIYYNFQIDNAGDGPTGIAVDSH